jgi:hypothetical protein
MSSGNKLLSNLIADESVDFPELFFPVKIVIGAKRKFTFSEKSLYPSILIP